MTKADGKALLKPKEGPEIFTKEAFRQLKYAKDPTMMIRQFMPTLTLEKI